MERPQFPFPQVNREDVAAFFDACFRHADRETFINLRAFFEGKDDAPPVFIEPIKVGAPNCIERIVARIHDAAIHPEPVVFCPPVCTFKEPNGAAVNNLAEGVALSVECDSNARAALSKLASVLGAKATAVVASGGVWKNPETQELESKLHGHWRLKQPTRDAAGHELLREARALAAELVGADATAKAIVHPLRWPGSWHRKNPKSPRIARLKTNPDSEIELTEALRRLREACPPKPRSTESHARDYDRDEHGHDLRGSLPELEAAMRVIPNANVPWPEWNRVGLALWMASDGQAFTAFDAWSRKSSKYNPDKTRQRWQHYAKSPPSHIGAGSIFFLADQAAPNWRARRQGNGAGGAPANIRTWDDPDWSLLDDRRGDLPDFPLDTLSEATQAWVKRAAAGAGVTVAHVAVPMLGIVSSLIGTARRVKATSSWLQPMTSWAAIVGFSGTGKTPGIDAIKRALAQMQRDDKERIGKLQRKHESKVEAAKAARAHWKKAVEAATESGKPTPEMPANAADAGKFIAPRLYVADGTIERFGELLTARQQGMLRLSDELSGMFMNMSRYSGGQDNEFWLEAWNGNPYNVERIGRALQIDHLLIGVVGGMQPDKLAESFKGPADGMYARFLFSWPPEPSYKPLSDDALEVDPDIYNALKRIDRLAELADNNLVVRSIPISDDARARFEQFRQFAHRGKDALEGREREWWAKSPAHVLRLAGTLCLLVWAMGPHLDREADVPTVVDENCMDSAIRLVGDYFWPHARAALRQIGLSERHVDARRVLLWARAKGKDEVSREEIRRDALGQKLDAEGTEQVLFALVRAGFASKTVTPSGPHGGKPVVRWKINPALLTPTAETAETAETPSAAREGRVSAVSAVSAPPSGDRRPASVLPARNNGRGSRETCAQCQLGDEPLLHVVAAQGVVRLHRQCLRFWFADHAQPQGAVIASVLIAEVIAPGTETLQ